MARFDSKGRQVVVLASGGGGGSSPLTTKGDVYTHNGSADARLGVGANGQVLTANSGEATGLEWTTVAGTGDVTAAANITDNAIVRGDGGAKGVQESGILIDDSDNVTGVNDFTTTNDIYVGGGATEADTALRFTAAGTAAGFYGISSNAIGLATSGREVFRVSTAGLIINENSHGQVDVRMETNTETHAFYLNAGTEEIAFGGAGTFANATLGIDLTNQQLQVQDGTEAAPSYTFSGTQDLGMYRQGANILAFATSGEERLRMTNSSAIFNEPSDNNFDFRVESATYTHAFYIDCSEDQVAFGGAGTFSNAILGVDLDTPVVNIRNSAGSLVMQTGDTGVVFNENGGGALDFRVETNNESNALLVDAGNEQVAFGGAGTFANAALGVDLSTNYVYIASRLYGNDDNSWLDMSSNNKIDLIINSDSILEVSATGVEFNEQQNAVDFIFRTDTMQYGGFLDGGSEFWSFGANSVASALFAIDLANSVVETDAVKFRTEAYYDEEVDNGNSSTADTIDWTNGNKQLSTLTDNCTYTFTAPSGPASVTLRLIQDATGSRTATWPATVKWPGGTAPTLSTAASAIDVVSFYYDGTNYYGQASLNFS